MKRILLVALVVFLYIVPYYRYREAERQWQVRHVQSEAKTAVPGEATPFYREDFVNEEKSGIICHVSSVCPLDYGKMACTWYAGSKESAPDVKIYLSVFDEGTSRWSSPGVVVDRDTCSKELGRYVRKVGNPLIYSDGRGRIWLFYSSVIAGGWSGSSLNYKVSLDSGESWSRSGKLVLSPFFNLTENVKDKGLNLDDGSFLLPVYHELMGKYSQLVHLNMTGGSVQYDVRKITESGKEIQPSLVAAGGRALTAFFRNAARPGENRILASWSEDLGRTWSQLKETPLPNPDSGFDMIKLSDGAYLGVINNSFDSRDNLTLVLSRDGGKTWKAIKALEDRKGDEYSYPSINRSRSGLYHLTYTYERKRIKHIVFNESWVREMEEQSH